jgi:colanic acid/amylovoran biosynthesis glycosyltransferase
MTLKIAYLINQYPKISHAFIRREILALERQGIDIQRIALRGWNTEILDSEDKIERERTQYVLKGGIAALLGGMVRVVAGAPMKFFSGLSLALQNARRADRPLRFHIACLAEACIVLLWIRASGATHLHAHFGTNAAEVAMLVRALGGPPYSFTVHGPEEFDKPEFLHIKEKVRDAAFVVAITDFAASQLYRWIEYIHWPKIKVVHCGLEPAFHQNAPPTVGIERRRFVSLGRLSAQKGQLLMVEAANALIRMGVDFELVIVGDGELRAEIEALIAKYSLQDRVRLLGSVSTDTLRSEILKARAMVLPTFAEGLPMVIMEAMALRRPVLSTYVAGIPELVVPGKSGWLFPAGSLDALVTAVQDCLAQSDEDMRAMGEFAHFRALERHSIDTEARKLVVLFAASSAQESPA